MKTKTIKLIATAMFLSFGVCTHAQWSSFSGTPNVIYVTDTSKNLGIGTDDPRYKLHLEQGSVFFSKEAGRDLSSGAGTKLIWLHDKKGAFRTGQSASYEWTPPNIGEGSFGTGIAVTASGSASFACGVSNVASGDNSFAAGSGNIASGNSAFASGINNTASGDNTFVTGDNSEAYGGSSFATGLGTFAGGQFSFSAGEATTTCYNSFSIGRNNVGGGNLTSWVATDPLFEVGIGSLLTPANALTILKNGNTGIGSAAPTQKLDVAGSVRFSGALMPNNLPGTVGQVLMSQGGSLPPMWQNISFNDWSLTGNSGTNPAFNFLGTIDNKDMLFKVNNQEAMRIYANKNIAIQSPAGLAPVTLLQLGDPSPGMLSNWPASCNKGIMIGNYTDNLFIGMKLLGPYDADALISFGDDNVENLIFSSNNDLGGFNEHMRITHAGRIGVNESSPAALFHIKGNTATDAELFLQPGVFSSLGHYATLRLGDMTSHYIRAEYGGGMQFYDYDKFCFTGGPVVIAGCNPAMNFMTGSLFKLTVLGDAAKTGYSSWDVVSDARLKKDVKTFSDGLNVLKQINPVTFRYNGKNDLPTEEEYVGIIAQEMQKVAPYTVKNITFGDGEYLSFNAGALDFILINSVKEQQAQIEERDAEINALRSDVELLKSSLAELKQSLAAVPSSPKNTITLSDVPKLEQNIPNPFNGSTVIKYYIPGKTKNARINVYDSKGTQIKTLQIETAGNGELTIKTSDLHAGEYFYELIIDGNKIDYKKMILIGD